MSHLAARSGLLDPVSSFLISLRWPILIIYLVDKTNLPCNTPHRHNTTVSLETYPFIYLLQLFEHRAWKLHCVMHTAYVQYEFEWGQHVVFMAIALWIVARRCLFEGRTVA